jgi:hypothetical protein
MSFDDLLQDYQVTIDARSLTEQGLTEETSSPTSDRDTESVDTAFVPSHDFVDDEIVDFEFTNEVDQIDLVQTVLSEEVGLDNPTNQTALEILDDEAWSEVSETESLIKEDTPSEVLGTHEIQPVVVELKAVPLGGCFETIEWRDDRRCIRW